MARAFLQPKQKIIIDGERCTILRSIAKDEWQIEMSLSGRIDTKSTEEIFALLMEDRLEFETHVLAKRKGRVEKQIIALELLPEKQREKTKVRYAYVMAVKRGELTSLTEKSLAPIIAKTAQNISSDYIAPSWVTVYRWYKQFIDAGEDIRGLVPKNSAAGRNPKYDSFVVDAVKQAVDLVYMSEERGTIKDALEHATYLIMKENRLRPTSSALPLPTRYLIKSEISQLPAYDVAVARKGKQAADREFRSVLGVNVSKSPLENAEIDHTILDVFVVDEEAMLPLGRPTLTICMDSMSRCVLGLYVGFEPPSHSTVAQCLKQCFLPKLDIKEKFPRLINDWDCFGIMETLVVDNGLEFHGHSLDRLGERYGVSIQYSPRKKPWFKPYVERYIGTLNKGVIQKIPGTTFSNIFEKEDYDALKKATITLSTLIEIIHIWIIDYYHQSIHRTLRQQPIKVWRDNIDHIPVPLPAKVSDLDALTGYIGSKTLSHKGIEHHSLLYNSNELRDLRHLLGKKLKVSIRYNVNDLGHIYVINPKTNELIKVLALRQDYAKGLSKWQHDVCKKYATQHLNRSDVEALAEVKETIRELIANDLGTKKLKTRKRIGRFNSNMTSVQPTKVEQPFLKKEKVPESSEPQVPQVAYERKKLDVTIENRIKIKKGDSH